MLARVDASVACYVLLYLPALPSPALSLPCQLSTPLVLTSIPLPPVNSMKPLLLEAVCSRQPSPNLCPVCSLLAPTLPSLSLFPAWSLAPSRARPVPFSQRSTEIAPGCRGRSKTSYSICSCSWEQTTTRWSIPRYTLRESKGERRRDIEKDTEEREAEKERERDADRLGAAGLGEVVGSAHGAGVAAFVLPGQDGRWVGARFGLADDSALPLPAGSVQL